MKKLIALAVVSVLSFAAQAETLTCSTQTLIVNGNTVAADVPVTEGSIILSQPKVILSIDSYDIEFWKDGNDYRNDTGRIILDRSHGRYTMETAIKQEGTNNFVPTKVVYRCK